MSADHVNSTTASTSGVIESGDASRGTDKNSTLRTPHSALKWALLLLPLLYLWFRLINNLRVEWETNPQYSYGYIVPFLCIGLILHRWKMDKEKAESGKQIAESSARGSEDGRESGKEIVESRKPKLETGPVSALPASADFSFPLSVFQPFRTRPFSIFCILLFGLLAVGYLPTRLIELAVPEWRPVQWSLGFITVGITLVAVDLIAGRRWLRQLAFPICFLFVAIPWPTLIEQPVIQLLTRINAAAVIEVMGIIGVPAVQHGNVIEVGTGVVGVEEACSGIRSFQSSLMISLFLGALYDLTPLRRILFVPIGFLLAMIFNVGRTSFLTWVAAKKGVDAIAQYHDPAGLTILVGCTLGMWIVGMLMRTKKQQAEIAKAEGALPEAHEKTESGKQKASGGPPNPISAFSFQLSAFSRLALALSVWLVFVELGSQLWYRTREAKLIKGPNWTLAFPERNATFKDLPMDPKTFNLLRFDDGKQAAWITEDGAQWSGFYFNWQPGRVAGYLAKRHTPEICMPATGRELLQGPELLVVDVNGITLPIRRYLFGPAENPLHVYHCRWESGASRESFVEQDSARYNLVRAIWNGRGNQGQKVIEFIIRGTTDPEEAKQSLIRQLQELIKVEDQSVSGLEKMPSDAQQAEADRGKNL